MDIGIDLGTANIMISMENKGVVFYEPAVVAFNKKTSEIIAVGMEAYKMIGKAPDYIAVIRPLCDGVISDYDMTESLVRECIHRVTGRQMLMPRIVMCVPSLITDVESRAVIEAARQAGAQKVFLIEEPVAALMGAGIDIAKASGRMVVDIGGGTTDIAVMSMNGIVAKNSVKLAGNKIDAAIIKYVQNKYRILIGERTAENAKITLAQVYAPDGSREMTVKGRNLVTGLPAQVKLTDYDIYKAIIDIANEIIDAVKGVLEITPPELAGDIHSNGIVLTGGGALIGGLDKLIEQETKIHTYSADDPLRCVARGTSLAFKHLDTLLDGFERISLYGYSEI
ncbi:rod shape-determining protein [Huintestinicola sp.]|uniref:rod shape-determining protein n=1 Tax=Huintestinicola sp. TaxID=2981661 RepID=UPI003D7F0928